jgi:hypothetical protein
VVAYKGLLLARIVLSISLVSLAAIVERTSPRLYATGVPHGYLEVAFHALNRALRALSAGAGISTTFVFPLWLYLTTRNTWALGASDLRFTPRERSLVCRE